MLSAPSAQAWAFLFVNRSKETVKSNRDPQLSFEQPTENRRRDFFKLIGAGAAAAGALPLLGLPKSY